MDRRAGVIGHAHLDLDHRTAARRDDATTSCGMNDDFRSESRLGVMAAYRVDSRDRWRLQALGPGCQNRPNSRLQLDRRRADHTRDRGTAMGLVDDRPVIDRWVAHPRNTCGGPGTVDCGQRAGAFCHAAIADTDPMKPKSPPSIGKLMRRSIVTAACANSTQ